ncbi:MAG: hypothetical protein PHH28_17310, partial [Desulfuromonadaceae bacterium]|nr:hypothetical protein [Desulfuromonadaceae bacterium]
LGRSTLLRYYFATVWTRIAAPFFVTQVSYTWHYPPVTSLEFPHLPSFKKSVQNFRTDHIKTIIDVFNSD